MYTLQRGLRRPLVASLVKKGTSAGHLLRVPASKPMPLRQANASPIPSRFLHSSAPSNGVADSLRNAYGAAFSGAEEKREEKIFAVQMSYLSNKDKPLDGNAFLELLAEMKVASGMGGVKENLPWVQNNPALQEFKDQELIVCSLTPAERKDLSMVRIAAKKRIAASSNLPFASVESLLSQIENMAHIQKWMVKRIDDGKVLPKNAAEMQNMLTAPGEGIRKRNANRRRMSNPGMGKMSKMRKK